MKGAPVISVVSSTRTPSFLVTASDGHPLRLHSFLIVDSAAQPVWEFARQEYEPADDVQIVGVAMEVDVFSDAFREALQRDSWSDTQVDCRQSVTRYEITYGSVPVGHKQTIPLSGAVAALSSRGKYRAVVFSSTGSGSISFNVE